MQIFNDGNVVIRFKENEGFIFFHMDVSIFKTSSYKNLKSSFQSMREMFNAGGHEFIFCTTDNLRVTDFWESIYPLEDLKKFGPHNEYWIGAWLTKDD